ncbi:hypothetical protein SPAB_01747 [Salmonella enterica subsp. enterica serovar Paratyphi B str. SPB7]|uniref:Uncharacterized protein n=1 Tax=Salmonella paratyphi B (strain ATCC BAA-1250 / SPB7) TaxID=1016998 RepID=A0A6C6Z0L7_SALPB|nr:hypothetical protein SPAB_01747 [Salmonella enterica subsp. enterica serovar Paratyphi B str. SPB7]
MSFSMSYAAMFFTPQIISTIFFDGTQVVMILTIHWKI